MGSHRKKLPATTTLGALRTLCERLCRVRAGDQRLSLRSRDAPFPELLEGEDDSQTLAQMGVQVGLEFGWVA